jgi:hypothetical protein
MKGDFSRFTFDRRKHYTGVRLQQGRVQLDADWNEQEEIAAYQRQTLAIDLLGPTGAPETGGGFSVSVSGNVSNNKLRLSAGRFYLDGLLCENESLVTLDAQPDLPGVALPTAEGNYLAYLDVWQRSVSALEDIDLLEPALGGPDTATRVRTVWQVRLTGFPGSSVPAGWQPDPRTEPQLAARLHSVSQGSATPRENRLYRVEIHERAQLDNAGNVVQPATYKWSRDNGAVAASIENPESVEGGAKIVLTHQIGPEQALQRGQWLEVTDEGRVLRGEPGVFAPVSSVAGQVINVSGWPDPGDSMPSFSGATMVRLWDSVGAIPVPPTAAYQQLDDTVEVSFAGNARDYRTGDYWLIPVRAASGVLWPEDSHGDPAFQPRQGVRHHYAPLALLKRLGSKWSVVDATLRKTFQNLEAKLNRNQNDTMTASLTIQNNLTVNTDLKVLGKVTANSLTGSGLTLEAAKKTTLTLRQDSKDRLIITSDGKVQSAADVEITKRLKISGVSPGTGRVLTSDASGNATWKSLPSIPDQRFVVLNTSPQLLSVTLTNWVSLHLGGIPTDARAVMLYAIRHSSASGFSDAIKVRQQNGSLEMEFGPGQFLCTLVQGHFDYQTFASYSLSVIGYFPG